MKKYYYTLLAFCFLSIINAQIINFPDANFKAKLLAADSNNYIATNLAGNSFRIDDNNDGEIEINEALNIKELDVSSNFYASILDRIHNLSGLEYFTNIEKIVCNNNLISNLYLDNNLMLKSLNCHTNQLTSLNLVNNNLLTNLNFSTNLLTSINLSNNTALLTLECFNNQLTTLNLAVNTSLMQLNCFLNALTNLDVSNNTELIFFHCNNNQLTNLNLINNIALKDLDCSSNLLTSLNLIHNTALNYVDCTANQLITLDLNNSAELDYLFCAQNQLVNLFIKNGKNETVEFSSNPNLQYICTDNAQITDMQDKINQYNYSATCQVNTYCNFTPGGTFYKINGATKFDINSNGCDINDFYYPNLIYNITNGTNNGSLISNNSGNYSIPVQAGTHTIAPILQNPTYFNVSPTSATITFPATASPATQNFCITPNGNHQDIEVVLIPLNPARSGFDANYKIVYKNKGNITTSGNVSLFFSDAETDFVSSIPALTSQNGSSLYWDYLNLLPFETREILITLNLNSPQETPALNSGDRLYFEASITPIIDDEASGDNVFEFQQTVVNSYDPNNKTCLQGNSIVPAKVGEFVHYMIRFENTGTFPAQNVVVKDLIDLDKFEIATLAPISGSHEFITRIDGNKVEFIFENINLPFDNATNDGYITFKIKTKSTLILGNTFSNSANIYFDYNFPIITNTATTTVANPLAVNDFELSNYVNFYPNPAKNILNFDVKINLQISSISIYNTLGQIVQVITNPENSINISDLKSGVYTLKIVSDKGISNEKFIKE
ncbi:MAG: T9SS type A sorting domain-containing protein [Flavobacterium sp.]|nr:T9SS type A sorting domain-containing protein [Flavobacterium sp.]